MADDAAEKLTFPTDEELLVTRVFQVPKQLVFRAWTTPELVRRWWPGKRGTMTITEIEFRVGGRWRYGMVTYNGAEVIFSGEFREIVADERIVYTEAQEGQPGTVVETTVTFSEVDGATTVSIHMRHGNRRDRDAHHRYMGDGLHDALDLLEQVAISEASA